MSNHSPEKTSNHEHKHKDANLDEKMRETFPASDAPAPLSHDKQPKKN